MPALFKIDNFKSFLTTGLGVGIAQLIALLSVPFIARMSGPEVFGEYSYYNSIVVLLCVFTSLKLEFAVFTVPWRLYPYLKLLVNWLLPVSSALLGLVAAYWLKQSVSAMWELTPFIALLLLGACLFEFVVQDNIKLGRFKANAIMRISRAVATPIAFMLFYQFVGASPESILGAFAVANLVATFAGSKLCFKSPVYLLTGGVIRAVFAACKRVIYYLVPGHFLNRYSAGALVLLSGVMGYQSIDIAKYALVEKLVIAPVSIITVAISDVVKREILKNPRLGLANYYRLSVYSVLIAGVGVLIVIFSGEAVITLAMGGEWAGIGSYAIAMLPYFTALLIFSPITHTYTVLNKQHYDFYWQVFHSLILTISVVVGMSYDFLTGVWSFSVAAAGSLVVSAFLCRYLILQSEMAAVDNKIGEGEL